MSFALMGFAFVVQTVGIIPRQDFLPEEVGTVISPQMSDRHHNQPIVFDGFVILTGNAEHEVWDISDPYNPVYVSEMVSVHNSGEAESHQVTMGSIQGKYYMATTSGKGIDIWDVSIAQSPKYVAALVLPGINYGDVNNGIWGLSWQGNHLFLGATNHGLYVVDVSDPSNPFLASQVPLSQLGGLKPGPLFALGNLLCITSPKGNNGVATLDISDPIAPQLLDVINYRNNHSYIGGFYGNHAVLINPLRFYDVTSDPQHIEQVASLNVVPSEYVSFDNHKLFLGGLRGGSEGIHVFDISDLDDIQNTLNIPGRDPRWDDQFSVAIGNLIIMSDDQKVDGKYVGSVVAVAEELKDTLPPTLLYANPANGAMDIPGGGAIGLSFSDWIEFSSVDSGSFQLRKKTGEIVSGSWGWLYTTINFEPDQDLEPLTEYEIYLPSGGLTDLSGNALNEDILISFTTDASTPPRPNPQLDDIEPVYVGDSFSWSLENPDTVHQYYWFLNDRVIGAGSQVTYATDEPGRHQGCLKMYRKQGREFYFEAENTDLMGGVSIMSNNDGFSGAGYADFPGMPGDSIAITWAINLVYDDLLDVEFGYANGRTEARPLNLYVNDVLMGEVNFSPTGSWTTWGKEVLSDIALIRGENRIALVANAGSQGPNIDYLSFQGSPASIFNPGPLAHTECFVQPVNQRPSAAAPQASQRMIMRGRRIWSVNPDNNSIAALDADTHNKIAEIPVGGNPTSLAWVGAHIWVVNRDSYDISIVDPGDKTVIRTISLPLASQPTDILVSPDGKWVYVSLSVVGKVVRISPDTESITASASLGENETAPVLGGLAIDSSGQTLYVGRLISNGVEGQVYAIDCPTMTLRSTISLENKNTLDASNSARGIPNYIERIAINPAGNELWVASKQDNLMRGGFRDGNPLDHQTTVRCIISRIDLNQEMELIDDRIDIDNSERTNSIGFNDRGDFAFATLPGNNKVIFLDAYTGEQITEFAVGLVPDACLYDTVTNKLFVHNFLSRSISVLDVGPIMANKGTGSLITTTSMVEHELLEEEVLKGKRFFYDASSKRLNQSGYMSCASCHLDGGHDGNVWDFTSLGEGFRNTTDLRGRAGTKHGRLHWTGNFDEVHDFENQIRHFGAGTGLMDDDDFFHAENPLGEPKAGLSDDLDALASYITSLESVPPSPYKPSPDRYSTLASLGLTVFEENACGSCHSGVEFTDSPSGQRHDVGTAAPSSGQRIGQALTGFDTPTLKGLWNTAPYLHDGSAHTIEEAVLAHRDIEIAEEDLDALVQFLLELDETDIAHAGPYDPAHIFQLYPNPVTHDRLFIRVADNLEVEWNIYAADGRLIKTGSGNTVDLQSVRNGIYVVEVVTSLNRHTGKIIISR